MCMTDEERNIITSVWNDMVVRKKLEDDPYSLTREELYALENNDRLNEKIALLVKDALVRRAIKNNERFFSH